MIDVSVLIDYKIQCLESECPGLYSDGIRNDAVQPYSVVGDVSNLRAAVSGV